MMQVEVKSGTMTKDEIQYYILLVKKRWGHTGCQPICG